MKIGGLLLCFCGMILLCGMDATAKDAVRVCGCSYICMCMYVYTCVCVYVDTLL